MGKEKYFFVIFFLLIVIPMVFSQEGPCITRITNNSEWERDPDFSGNFIVWYAYFGGNPNIYGYSVTSGTIQQQTTHGGDYGGYDPAIDGEWIAYQQRDPDGSLNNYAIRVCQARSSGFCSSNQIITTTAGNIRVETPQIHDRKVVWVSYYADPNNGNIRYRDLDEADNVVITSDATAHQHSPHIYGDYIVYLSDETGSTEIWMHQISSGTKTQITSNSVTERDLGIFNNHVVWADNSSGTLDVYMYDIYAGTTATIVGGPGNQWMPFIYNRLVVYEDNASGNEDLYVYDITDSSTQLLISSSSSKYPVGIYERQIAFIDYESGDQEMYLFDFDDPSCTIPVNNQPPFVTDVTISPSGPAEDNDLTCSYNYYDMEGDSEDVAGTEYAWLKDGVVQPGLTTNTVDSSNTSQGEYWVCQVTPYALTGASPGDPTQSTAVLIGAPCETRITNNTESERDPDIGGDWVVWYSYLSGNANVWGYRISTGTTQQQTTHGGDYGGYDPAIDGEWIAYQQRDPDGSLNNYAIRVCRASPSGSCTSASTISTTAGNIRVLTPQIQNRRVVWVDYATHATNGDIVFRDLDEASPVRITSDAAVSQSSPDIYGKNIIYLENIGGIMEIMLHDLSTGVKYQVTDQASLGVSAYNPKIFGRYITWYDARNGDVDLFYYDLGPDLTFGTGDDEGEDGLVVIAGSIQYYQYIYDNVVFYRNSDAGEIDAYAVDMITKIPQPIVTLPGSVQSPMGIYGDYGIFYDNRDGVAGGELYLIELTLQCGFTPPPPPNEPPTTEIIADPTSGNAPLNVFFTATCDDSDGTITSCMLDYGDGSPLEDIGSGAPPVTLDVTHTYTNSGGSPIIRTATLTAMDDDDTNSTTLDITVLPEVNNPPVTVIDTPTTDVTITVGDFVNFTGTASDGDGFIVAWSWDFSGGAPNSTVEDPGSVQFNNVGSYLVTFDAQDDDGDWALTPDTVNVTVNPVAASGEIISLKITGNVARKENVVDKGQDTDANVVAELSSDFTCDFRIYDSETNNKIISILNVPSSGGICYADLGATNFALLQPGVYKLRVEDPSDSSIFKNEYFIVMETRAVAFPEMPLFLVVIIAAIVLVVLRQRDK